nr:MAG TPA: hypothetical protein [Caudoviricetes sp.]
MYHIWVCFFLGDHSVLFTLLIKKLFVILLL